MRSGQAQSRGLFFPSFFLFLPRFFPCCETRRRRCPVPSTALTHSLTHTHNTHSRTQDKHHSHPPAQLLCIRRHGSRPPAQRLKETGDRKKAEGKKEGGCECYRYTKFHHQSRCHSAIHSPPSTHSFTHSLAHSLTTLSHIFSHHQSREMPKT